MTKASTDRIKGEFVCVVCPNGCTIDAEFIQASPPRLLEATGAQCKRGDEWIRQEIESPMRTIATSVPVTNGDYLCASVRTSKAIPLAKVLEVRQALRDIVLDAPVTIGQIIVSNPAGVDTNMIATRHVARLA